MKILRFWIMPLVLMGIALGGIWSCSGDRSEPAADYTNIPPEPVPGGWVEDFRTNAHPGLGNSGISTVDRKTPGRNFA